MKRQICSWLSFIFFTTVCSDQSIVYAQVLTDESNRSDVTVRIREPSIYLKQVIPPTFSRYPVRNNAFDIQATSDLIIDVVDHREGNNQWKLSYSLSWFHNQSSYEMNVSLKEGQFTASEGTIYQLNQDTTFKTGTSIHLVEVSEGSSQTYRYVIPKENFRITVPNNSPSGKYKAIQTVNLMNVGADVN